MLPSPLSLALQEKGLDLTSALDKVERIMTVLSDIRMHVEPNSSICLMTLPICVINSDSALKRHAFQPSRNSRLILKGLRMQGHTILG